MTMIGTVRSMRRKTKAEKSKALYTEWGEALQQQVKEAIEQGKEQEICPLSEYPRPQLVRENYTCLNGFWDYRFTREKTMPKTYEGKILVPFSPESKLSQVGRVLLPRESLWYRRKFVVDEIARGYRLLLHFGAVDQRASVYLNGTKVKKHTGGYLPFTIDITNHVSVGENELVVRVTDDTDTSYHARGKQKLVHSGIFYTPQSGIWQTVWYEWVPETYIKQLILIPKYDKKRIVIRPILAGTRPSEAQSMKVEITKGEQELLTYEGEAAPISLSVEDKRGEIDSWSPESPFLYSLKVTIGNDQVESYFAMRKIHVARDKNNVPRMYLNNQLYYQKGVLDQGYWPDGLYTPGSDAAYLFDILTMKELGYNMIRKHIKIEPLRWYYHCDTLGMLVWQDMVNGGETYGMLRLCYLLSVVPWLKACVKDHHYGYFSRKDVRGRKEWKKECLETVRHLRNCPCIVMWVLFNEGWGQFDSKELSKLVKCLDKTRLVDHASGWFDQKAGDIRSEHTYFRSLKVRPEKRAFVLSEFGGYACHLPGHTYSDQIFGYQTFSSCREFAKAYHALYKKQVEPLKRKGLCASVYTQLSDVEEEVNGILTFDRKCNKLWMGEKNGKARAIRKNSKTFRER